MMKFDDHETDIILISLQFFKEWADLQLDHMRAHDATYAAWYAMRYCGTEAGKLIARIEQFRKDQSEEKADG